MSRRLLVAVMACAALLPLSACESTLDPSAVLGEYALVAIGGDALPARANTWSGIETLADTIRLREDGTGERISVDREAGSGVNRRHEEAIVWRVNGDALEVSFPCPTNALVSCIAPPHLAGPMLPGMQWAPEIAIMYGRTPLYQRVGAR